MDFSNNKSASKNEATMDYLQRQLDGVVFSDLEGIAEITLKRASELKIASKVEKIVSGLPPDKKLEFTRLVQSKLGGTTLQMDGIAGKIICGIIEYIPSCRSSLLPMLPDIIVCCKKNIITMKEKLRHNCEVNIDCTVFRLIAALCQKFSSELISDLSAELLGVSFLLLDVIAIAHSFDAGSLAATAFCISLNTTLPVNDISSVLRLCVECTSDSPTITVREKTYELNIVKRELFCLCLSNAMLNCCSPALMSEAEHSQGYPVLLGMFPVLESSCKKYSKSTFFAFKVLATWLKKTGDVLERESLDKEITDKIYDALKVIVELVNTNWESPISGVRNQVPKLLLMIVDIFETKKISVEGPLAKTYTVTSLMQYITTELPWRMKTKFSLMFILLPQYGVLKALKDFPNVPDGLLQSLAYNHLLTVGTDVYKLCVKDLTLEEWSLYFFPLMKKIMFSNESVSKQNLLNYWIPPTIKFWPPVLKKFLSLFESSEVAVLLPHMFLLKLGRKEGLLGWDNLDTSVVKSALCHFNDMIQMQAFGAVCLAPKLTVSPTAEEYKMVELFLSQNVSSDSMPLRQSIITSFSYFLSRIRESCTCKVKQKENATESVALLKASEFLEWLHAFLIGNFEPGTNYQRRILSVQLYKIVLKYLNLSLEHHSSQNEEIEGYIRQENRWNFTSERSMIVLLQCIQDPSDDVQRIAATILAEHFCTTGDRMDLLLARSVNLCNSQLFYEAQSGALLLTLVARWSHKNGTLPCKLGKASNFTNMLLSLIENHVVILKTDLLQASAKTPVHGLLNTLYQVSVECGSPENGALEMEIVRRIVTHLEIIVHHMLKVLASKSSNMQEFAPSFAEMGQAIEGIIHNSTLGESVDEDTLQLTPEHQLVLNCIWLNLKECCTLAGSLAVHLCATCRPHDEMVEAEDMLKRCGKLILEVLTKCRHKGAIECAGVALSLFTKTVSVHEKDTVRNLPRVFLEDFLHALEHSLVGASVTRRSAGLAILVHRLVGSGPHAVQVLLHSCIKRLLLLAEREIPAEWKLTQTADLPQAQAIHLLKIITQDSALREEMAPYMSDLTLLCFRSFSSQVWTVRNAALQLFGAVIPKLLGKKKAQFEEVVGGSVTVEEIFTQFPDLHSYLLSLLTEAVSKEATDHSTLVSALVLLSYLSTGMKYWTNESFVETLFSFQTCFLRLLASPSHKVRRLAAKCFCGFTPYSKIYRAMVGIVGTLIDDRSNLFLHLPQGRQYKMHNEIHGALLVLKNFSDRLQVDGKCMDDYPSTRQKVKYLLKKLKFVSESSKYSFCLRSLCDELQETKPQSITNIIYTVKKHEPIGLHLGIMLWARTNVAIVCNKYTLGDFVPILKLCLESGCSEICSAGLSALGLKLEEQSIPEPAAPNLLSTLLDFCLSSKSTPDVMQQCLNMLLTLCHMLPVSLIPAIKLEKLKILYEKFVNDAHYGSSCCGISLAVLSGLIKSSINDNLENEEALLFLVNLITMVRSKCSPRCIEDLRQMAGLSLILLIPVLHDLMEICNKCCAKNTETVISDIFLCILDCALMLLQDEDCEIREVATEFTAKFASSETTLSSLNPHLSITMLLKYVSNSVPQDKLFLYLWQKLSTCSTVSDMLRELQVAKIHNPFDKDSDNIYEEEVKFIEFVLKSCLQLLAEMDDETKASVKANIGTTKDLIVAKVDDVLSLSKSCDELEHALSPVFCSPGIYLASKKLLYQMTMLVQLDLGVINLQRRLESYLEVKPFSNEC